MSEQLVSRGATGGPPVIRPLTFPFIVSLLVAILLAISSAAGLLYGQRGVYEPNPATLPTFLTQDVITLVVAIPLLLVSLWTARRGSVRGLLLWMGTLVCIAYPRQTSPLSRWCPRPPERPRVAAR